MGIKFWGYTIREWIQYLRDTGVIPKGLVQTKTLPNENVWYDSRLWDPDWSYKRRWSFYRYVFRALGSSDAQAITMASDVSYRWGR